MTKAVKLTIFILLLIAVGNVVATIRSDTSSIFTFEPLEAVYGRGIAFDLDWHPDGELLAIASGTGIWLLDKNLTIVDWILPNLASYQATYDYPSVLEWGLNGEYLAVFYLSGRLRVIRWADRTLIFDAYITEVSPTPRDVITWHPFELKLAIADYVIDIEAHTRLQPHIYDVYWGRSNDDPPLYQRTTGQLFWSPDGSQYISIESVAGCSPCMHYAIYDTQTGAYIRRIADRGSGEQFLWQVDNTVRHYNLIWTADAVINSETGYLAYISVADAAANIPGKLTIVPPNRGSNPPHQDAGYSTDVGWTFERDNQTEQNYTFTPMQVDWQPQSNMKLTILTDNGDVVAIDAKTMQVVTSYPLFLPKHDVSLAWSPDGQHLAMVSPGTYEFPVRVWNIDSISFEPVQTFNNTMYALPDDAAYAQNVNQATIAWHSDENITIAERTQDLRRFHHEVSVWNPFTGAHIETIMQETTIPQASYQHFEHFPSYAYNDNYNLMIRFGFAISSTTFINRITMQPIGYLEMDNPTRFASVSPNNQFVATENAMWRIDSRQKLYNHPIGWDIEWSPDGWTFALATSDKVELYDAVTGNNITNYYVSKPKAIYWNPDGRYLAVLHNPMYDTDNIAGFALSIIDRLNSHLIYKGGANYLTLAWSQAGDQLALYRSNGTIEVKPFPFNELLVSPQ
jgi:WD40 repeat protein